MKGWPHALEAGSWPSLMVCFICGIVASITAILYIGCVNDARFFNQPRLQWQRRYEALRCSFVERLPVRIVAERFNYSTTYVGLLRHLFTTGKIDFSEPVPEGKSNRHRVGSQIRSQIRQ